MNPSDKPVVWLHAAFATPPMSKAARMAAGHRLRYLQAGGELTMPHTRPVPAIGKRCHELRINDGDVAWRIVYRIDAEAILVLAVFEKMTAKTPRDVIDTCRRRLQDYDRDRDRRR